MPTFGKAEIRNLTKVIQSGTFCDKRGGYMDQFRDDFAKALKAPHAISGATAMLLMQAIPGAIGAGAGDEIICDPVVQFHGIACLHNNIVPVWADVRKDNFLMDPASVAKKITRRTRAIWVTHLWGYAAEVDKLRRIADRHRIYLLEDCAHALLARYKGRYLGNWGHIGTFSFNMGKQLPTGEGGMAIAACRWLDARKPLPGSTVAPYLWSCLFHGERKGIDYGVFRAAMAQTGVRFGIGFTQRPAYMYSLFRDPAHFGRKGWPFGHKGRIPTGAGICPVAEDVIPRIVATNNMVSVAECRRKARALKQAIRLAESGDVKPLTYSPAERRVLKLIKDTGPMEPAEVIAVFDKRKWGHFDEHSMFATMEGLRDRFPEKLSHAGPRKFAYHKLS